jgi:hypothetical protein
VGLYNREVVLGRFGAKWGPWRALVGPRGRWGEWERVWESSLLDKGGLLQGLDKSWQDLYMHACFFPITTSKH